MAPPPTGEELLSLDGVAPDQISVPDADSATAFCICCCLNWSRFENMASLVCWLLAAGADDDDDD